MQIATCRGFLRRTGRTLSPKEAEYAAELRNRAGRVLLKLLRLLIPQGRHRA